MSTADIANNVEDVCGVLSSLVDIARAAAPSRRERIATACLAGLLADPYACGLPTSYATEAVKYADAIIAELDKVTP